MIPDVERPAELRSDQSQSIGPMDGEWRRRSRWLTWIAIALSTGAFVTLPVWWAGGFLVAAGLCWISLGVLVLRDLGGIGSDNIRRNIEFNRRYLKWFSRSSRARSPSIAHHRRWAGGMLVLVGAGWVLGGVLQLVAHT